MEALRWVFWLHVVLVAPGAWICWNDWSRPELWKDWWRNPAYAKPLLVIGEIFIWCGALYVWRREKKQNRMKRGMWMMQEAVRLLDQGRIAEADELYRKGKELTGV